MTVTNGRHLIIDLHGCRRMPKMEELYKLFFEVEDLLDMKRLTQPYLVFGAPHDPGMTGFMIIETSHISIHTFEVRKSVAFDAYSCKEFSSKPIVNLLRRTFKPSSLKQQEAVRRV